MMYLLDVNALVALGLVRHEFHADEPSPAPPQSGISSRSRILLLHNSTM